MKSDPSCRDDRQPRPAAWIESEPAYRPPSRHGNIDLKLDSNEGAIPGFPDNPFAMASGKDATFGELFRRYPNKLELETQIARRHGIQARQVLVTCGGDDAIDRVCRVFLGPDREILLPEPTFEMIRHYATMLSARVTSIPWLGGAFPAAEFIKNATEATSLIAVVTPNNPTGGVATAKDLDLIVQHCPQAALLVDLAYVEFADDDLTEKALSIPQAIVIRTFSKAWGLAGLRVGYAMGSTKMIEYLRRAGSPYPVSGLSLAIAGAALDHYPSGRQDYILRVRDERTLLQETLSDLGGEVYSSEANFVLARFSDAKFISDALAAMGIAVRTFSALPDAIRITCPGQLMEFERLDRTLRTVCAPQAILLDMDGVLADESVSFRAAIQSTCAAFGETVSMESIRAGKLAGNANNDWDFTWRLLRERGVSCQFDDVKACFERFYQGTASVPGLWRHEKRLVDPQWLNELSQRIPLAIVTGRPRGDALRFLEAHDMVKYFQTIVCMEDGPAKPNPAPVALALERLGVTRAWMIGDTPDDVRAARAAGVLPWGIVAPGDDSELATEALQEAGVAGILDDIQFLDRFLKIVR